MLDVSQTPFPGTGLPPVPDIGQGYDQYRRLLLAALGRLARQGFGVPPDEGVELIHDFFVEAWPGVAERYDPTRGPPEPYLTRAFVQFARPRIVRLNKWRGQLSEHVGERASGSSPSPDYHIDVAHVRALLDQLPETDRALLLERVGASRSERALADALQTSRYRIRERSVEAFARLVAALGDGSVLDSRDWPLARALWAEGRSLSDAASALNLTESQARVGQRRIIDALGQALAAAMPRKAEATMDLCSVWKEFLINPAAPDRQAAVREISDELFEHIETCAVCSDEKPSKAALEMLYGMLADEAPGTNASTDPLLALRSSVDSEIREAMTTVLYPALPSGLAGQVRDLDPLTVYRACDAVAMFLQRQARLAPTAPLVLTAQGLSVRGASDVAAPRGTLVREIAIMAGIDSGRAEPLLNWAIQAARSQPRLLSGATASPYGADGVALTITSWPIADDLAQRWAPVTA